MALILGQFSFVNSKLSRITFKTVTVTTMLRVAGRVPLIVIVAVVDTILLLHAKRGAGVGNSTTVTVVSIKTLTVNCLLVGLFSASSGLSNSIYDALFDSASVLALAGDRIELYTLLSITIITMFILYCGGVFTIAFSRGLTGTIKAGTSLCGLLVTGAVTIIVILTVGLINSLLVSTLIVFPTLSTVQICGGFHTIAVYTTILSIYYTTLNVLVSVLTKAPINSAVITISVFTFLVFSKVSHLKNVHA